MDVAFWILFLNQNQKVGVFHVGFVMFFAINGWEMGVVIKSCASKLESPFEEVCGIPLFLCKVRPLGFLFFL